MAWRYNNHIGRPRKQRSFGWAFLELIGHLVYSALGFVSIWALAWGIGFVIHWLNSIFPFDSDEAKLIHTIRVDALTGDCFVVFVYVLVGTIRFFKDLRDLL